MPRHSFLLPLLLTASLSGCIAPLAIGGVGVGMHAVEDRGIEGVASDEAFRYQISSEALADANFINLNITVYKKRVLLTGVVTSEHLKRQAVAAVKAYPDVKQVIDGILVQEDGDLMDSARDTWLTTKLKTNLYANQDIYAPNYLIHTHDRIIYIFGTAQTQEEMRQVMEEAADISNVKRVVNLIEIKGPAAR